MATDIVSRPAVTTTPNQTRNPIAAALRDPRTPFRLKRVEDQKKKQSRYMARRWRYRPE
jgi:hypothetical protein